VRSLLLLIQAVKRFFLRVVENIFSLALPSSIVYLRRISTNNIADVYVSTSGFDTNTGLTKEDSLRTLTRVRFKVPKVKFSS
jgi:hypothetical protein